MTRIGSDFNAGIPRRGKMLLNRTEDSRGRDRSSAIRRAGNMAKVHARGQEPTSNDSGDERLHAEDILFA
jgi:hypothetical protein